MELYIEKTNSTDAREISSWKYSEPYNFYNNELTPETIHEMLDDSYYSVFDLDKELVGFFVWEVRHKFQMVFIHILCTLSI